jgi:voltage-gated sodium channel
MNIQKLVESTWFHNFIIGVIVFNGVILGVETYRTLSADFIGFLHVLDSICLSIFVIEITLKLFVYRLSFFKEGWNNFDFIIVAVALIPATEGLSILRAFRIFRVLRLITAVTSIRRVVSGMLHALARLSALRFLANNFQNGLVACKVQCIPFSRL